MAEETPDRKRRIRYRGTHPRRFEEKYKELNPDQYADDVKKVMERGQTPAGMHRSICVAEILEILAPVPGNFALDATLGFGGHSSEILKRIIPFGHLISLDVDPLELPRTEARMRALGYGHDVLTIKQMNFAGIPKLLMDVPQGFDCILADLGVSSMQIDNPARGFTFKVDGPLDLRLNPTRGQSASALLKTLSQKKLCELLIENADEPHAEIIAKSLVVCTTPLETTSQVAAVIKDALGNVPQATRADEIKKSLQRTFQALRIEVNDEFGALTRFLESLPDCLAPGGRVAILSFHSGEDRRVKKSFQKLFREGIYSSIAPDPIRPSSKERHDNPRSVCAKLRWAIKGI